MRHLRKALCDGTKTQPQPLSRQSKGGTTNAWPEVRRFFHEIRTQLLRAFNAVSNDSRKAMCSGRPNVGSASRTSCAVTGAGKQGAVAIQIREFQIRHPTLLGSHDVPGTPQFHVHFGNFKAIVCATHCFQPASCVLTEVRGRHQDAVTLACSPTDASPQLMELRQSKSLGTLNHHHTRIGDVDPHFDDRGGEEFGLAPWRIGPSPTPCPQASCGRGQWPLGSQARENDAQCSHTRPSNPCDRVWRFPQ